MKKLSVLLVVIAAIFAMSCSDSNIGEPQEKNTEPQEIVLYNLNAGACSFEEATIDFEAAIINSEKLEVAFDISPFFKSINMIESTLNKVKQTHYLK